MREPDLWRQLARAVADGAWATALYYRTQYQLWQPYLKDYYPNQGYRGWPLVTSWLDT
jgi:hypothetical protein